MIEGFNLLFAKFKLFESPDDYFFSKLMQRSLFVVIAPLI